MPKTLLAELALLALGSLFASAGTTPNELKVLPPITHGNLTLFPVVGGQEANTAEFLTLDEGIRSGVVIVTEATSLQGLMRRPVPQPVNSVGQVNRLVLVNNSTRPLLLLAGEIVTGGKQDRVIAVDRIVPPKSQPIDLSVFCVEPGRWVETSDRFGSMTGAMAQPSVRRPAMAYKNQASVWNEVGAARQQYASAVPAAATYFAGTTSYAKAMQNPDLEKKVSGIASEYDDLLRDLRKSGAKGVVVAVNGQITWADIFASTDLLAKYWNKLIRSYVAESLTNSKPLGSVNQQAAQSFMDHLDGRREFSETEPGIFRRTEITGDGFKVFTLTSLVPKTDFVLHLAKMSVNPNLDPLPPRFVRHPDY